MSQVITQMPQAEQAVMALVLGLETDPAVDPGWVGGDFAFDPATMPWYIQISRVPGGRAGQIQGNVIIDIDVFASDYLIADSVASALDALLLGYPHVVEVEGRKVVLDSVYQNLGPGELPWEDDSTSRIGSTYSITVRRQ
jgi:hypothetical protein